MPVPVPVVVDPTLGPGTPGSVEQRRFAILGDVLLGGVDAYGTFVYITDDIAGWEGGPGTTGTGEQRAADHGAWINTAYLPPRVIGLSLQLYGGSFELVSQSISRIVGAVPLSTLDDFTVYNGSLVRTVKVRQEGEVLVTQKGAGAKMSISLYAPDPRKYDTDVVSVSTGLPQTTGGLSLPVVLPVAIGAATTSGVLSVTNAGNMNTSPTLTVVGPSPAFTLTHVESGRTLRSAEPVAAGRFLVIDMDRRRALLDGTAPRVVTGSWFDYAPGVNTVAFSASTYDSSALLVSEHRSAWR